MIVLGLVLLLLVVAVTAIAVSTGGDPVRLHLHWFTIGTNGAALFVAGAGTLVLAVLAGWLLRIGLRRARRRRREMKDLRQRAAAGHDQPHVTVPGASKAPPSASKRHLDADDYYDSAPRD